MNTQLDRDTAERLLAGTPGAHPPLAALLTAAAVPGRPSELSSEQDCVAAFRAAQFALPRRPGRRSRIKAIVTRVVTVKVIAALAASGAGGLALAATSGGLHHDPLTSSPAGVSVAAHPGTRAKGTSGATHGAGAPGSADNHPQPTASASAGAASALVGLCHSYLAGSKSEHGKALASPAYRPLLTAAGSADQVEPYCQALLATPAPPTDAATLPGKGSDRGHSASAPPGRSRKSGTGTEH
jgi:hypothetical protein